MDRRSYIAGELHGYEKGYDDGAESGNIVITGTIAATDDGEGNITLTEVTNG